jgi:hypothetical protein
MRHVFVGSFATEKEILEATRGARERGLRIVDVYTPYAVHGLDKAMGLSPSRLSWVCFALGLFGVFCAFGMQYWTMAIDWPINVGGKPWNSWPAYVPVAFECMVLCAGLGVVLAFFFRCRLYPGKEPKPIFQSATDDRFVLVLEAGAEVPLLFKESNAFRVEERMQ